MPRELLVTGPRACSVVDREERAIASNEVRARALFSGISHGTELQLWRGTSPFRGQRFDPELRLFVAGEEATAYPIRIGYEWVGRVEEVGSDVHDVSPGALVHLPRPHADEHIFEVDRAAGLPFTLPGSLSPERATLVQTTTIALQAVHDASLKLGDRVAVFGLGAFGLLTVQLARMQGATWIAASDPIADRRTFASRLAVDLVLDPAARDVGFELRRLDGVGVDVAIEFSGSAAALRQAMRSVRVGGTVVAAGFYPEAELALGEEFHHNRLTLLASMGGWASQPREARWPRSRARGVAAELLVSGRLRTDGLITHRFALDEAGSAYELIDRRPEEVLRAVFAYS